MVLSSITFKVLKWKKHNDERREMKKLLVPLCFLCAVTLVFGAMGSASATLIFQDDFKGHGSDYIAFFVI